MDLDFDRLTFGKFVVWNSNYFEQTSGIGERTEVESPFY